MVIKKMSFVFIVFAFAIMGTVISSVSAEITSEKATKEAERIARRDNMIAGLKAEYAAKVGAKKAEVTKIFVEKKVETTEAEPIAAEKISEIKDAVESVSERGEEEVKSGADEVVAKKITEAEPIAAEKISEIKDAVERGVGEAKSSAD